MTPGRWWARRWLQAVAVKGSRQGRACAKEGQVLSCDFGAGRVAARVQGGWESRLIVDPFDELQWHRVLDGLTRRPVQAARLLAGEMPEDLESLFADAGVSLVPRGGVAARCTCPSSTEPGGCVHPAAVAHAAADALSADPFLLFALRGRTRTELLAALRGAPATSVLPSDPALFYATPSLEGFAPDLIAPPTDVVLAGLGAPASLRDFASALAPAYETIARNAGRVIGG